MGSPVSVVAAEIVMKNIEEQALASYKRTIPLWLRYVDDTFTTLHKDEIDDFHEHLNRKNAHIQFTKEIEDNGKIPFLDCLVIRDNNRLQTTVYRKPTHTDRLYNCDFVTRNSYRTKPNETNTNLTPTTKVTIPYIKGTSEIIARILQPYNIRVAHRPITILRKLLTNVKDKDQPRDKEQFIRSNAATARPLISVRPAEI